MATAKPKDRTDVLAAIGDLRAWNREQVEAYIEECERPLCDELAALPDKPMTHRDRIARELEIRDERADLWAIRALWRKLHRTDDAGPDQQIG